MQSVMLDAIRGQVDHLRHGVAAGHVDPACIELMLEMSARSSVRAPVRYDREEQHDGSGRHLCPWNTCQATRHG